MSTINYGGGVSAIRTTNDKGEMVYKLVRNGQTLKKKTTKMTSFKKYLNTFFWYDQTSAELLAATPKPFMSLEYPTTFRTHFGNAPALFLKINDKVMPHKSRAKFETYIINEGFHVVECGTTSFKYCHRDRGIVISGEFHAVTSKRNRDDDDNDETYNSGDENIFITLVPSMENKVLMERLLAKITKSYMVVPAYNTDKFYMIAQNNSGLYTQKTTFKSIPIKGDRFDLFYGENFPHKKMAAFIDEDTDNLMLLHGDPGTGKSNYIKHIITNAEKKVIYIPPSMLSVLSTPGFVSFVMENKNSILLIEDAEEVLSTDRNSATNNLLGLTDGFLKDALNLKIICTFNCDIGKIDPALMRKGRMYFEYKFDVLTQDEGQKLADFMKLDRTIDKPMTLADIFNEEENSIKNSFEDRRIGFC
jgi:hypothetical protein